MARLKTKAILVAEDDKFLRFITQKQLQKLGYEVDVAENGKMAVEAIRNSEYSLVFMDVHMPVLDGLEAVRFIRQLEIDEQWQPTPIIAMTADPDRERCLEVGMQDYLRKPAMIEDLQRMLQSHALEN